MTPEELVNTLPDSVREALLPAMPLDVLEAALRIALRRGAAYVASMISFELGRRSAAA